MRLRAAGLPLVIPKDDASQISRTRCARHPIRLGDGRALRQPTSLRVKKLSLPKAGNCHFVHFTDFHHKGNVAYAAEMVPTINDLARSFVCFTGDLVEDKRYAAEALSFIRQIQAPVYGSPGNHDYRCGASFAEYGQTLAATGEASWKTVLLSSRNTISKSSASEHMAFTL